MQFFTPGQVGIVFGSVKIKSIRTTQEIINDVNVLIDLSSKYEPQTKLCH